MRQSILTSAALLFSACANAMTLPETPVPESALLGEGVDNRTTLIASVPSGGVLSRTGWVFTTDSEQGGMGRYNMMDGKSNTLWHSQYSPTLHRLPHTITINMKTLKYVDGIVYQPRTDGVKNGNIGQHKIYVSTDCKNLYDLFIPCHFHFAPIYKYIFLPNMSGMLANLVSAALS
jgi:hypothetical protein